MENKASINKENAAAEKLDTTTQSNAHASALTTTQTSAVTTQSNAQTNAHARAATEQTSTHANATTTKAAQSPKTHLFTFMGTGAGCGVPAFFCTCPACMEARENPRARRGDCGAMVRRIGENWKSNLGATYNSNCTNSAGAPAGLTQNETNYVQDREERIQPILTTLYGSSSPLHAGGSMHAGNAAHTNNAHTPAEHDNNTNTPANAHEPETDYVQDREERIQPILNTLYGSAHTPPPTHTTALPTPPEHTPTLLIDAPPDTRHQLLREGVTHFDELLITHCHSDHISGLCEYEYMMQLATKKPIPTYGSVEALGEVAIEFHYMDYALDMHTINAFETHEFDGVKYTALPLTHAEGTFGYLIETPNTAMFYASDTGRLPKETRERIRDIDVLAMDATYWKSCPCPQSHHSVQECVEEGLELGAKKIYLTHLCMHYSKPITLAQLEEYCAQFCGRVQPAADGLSFEI